MRALLALLTALTLLGPVAAEAATKDSVAAAKDAWKEELKQFKTVSKISKQWTAAWSKENQGKMHAADVKLVEWRRGVLEDLREDGISTREAGIDEGAPKQERFRDMMVALRDSQARFDDETAPKGEYKKKSELLAAIVAELDARVDRYQARYEKQKAKLKGK